jgi:hypothetical protein
VRAHVLVPRPGGNDLAGCHTARLVRAALLLTRARRSSGDSDELRCGVVTLLGHALQPCCAVSGVRCGRTRQAGVVTRPCMCG